MVTFVNSERAVFCENIVDAEMPGCAWMWARRGGTEKPIAAG